MCGGGMVAGGLAQCTSICRSWQLASASILIKVKLSCCIGSITFICSLGKARGTCVHNDTTTGSGNSRPSQRIHGRHTVLWTHDTSCLPAQHHAYHTIIHGSMPYRRLTTDLDTKHPFAVSNHIQYGGPLDAVVKDVERQCVRCGIVHIFYDESAVWTD